MKRTLITLICMGLLSVMIAQTPNTKIIPDSRLYEVYSKAKIEAYQNEAPDKLLYLNFQVLGTCYVSSTKPANSQVLGDISEYIRPDKTYNAQQIASTLKINPLLFTFAQDAEKYNVYTVAGTNVYVIVYPFPVYKAKETEYLKKFGY